MTEIQLACTVVLSLVLPFALQLVKTDTISSNASRWVALGVSVLAGVVTGLVGGVPQDAAGWATCIFAVVGGVQAAYTLFKQLGVTDKWLDALLGVGVVSAASTAKGVVDDGMGAAEKAVSKAQGK